MNSHLIGFWHIIEMSEFDEDYFNMELQAYIQIKEKNHSFQFGLIEGNFNKKVENLKTFLANFEAYDMEGGEDMSGSIQVTLVDRNTIKGEFEFFNEDSTTFVAKRV
jgi:hypothetical protein